MISTLLTTLISLTLSTHNCYEPCSVKLTVKLQDPTQVKEVCIHFDGEDMERHSCWPPNSKTIETHISNISAGTYTVWADMTLAGGDTAKTDRQALHVLGE